MKVMYRNLVLGVMASFFFTPAAHAWFKVCNKTGDPATVAIGTVAKDPAGTSTGGHRGVAVEGWWKLDPGECNQVSDVDAGGHWVYYHAHGSGRTWEGTARLCVRSRRFTDVQPFLLRDGSCRPDWRIAGFRRAETAQKNHTVNLN